MLRNPTAMAANLSDLLAGFRELVQPVGAKPPMRFSPLIESIYRELMASFDSSPATHAYREIYKSRSPRPDRITSAADIAAECWYLFPTHFFKFRDALAKCALPQKTTDFGRSILGCADLDVLDVGAGVGTASLATIDFLHQWQSYLLERGHAPHVVNVTIQPIELNAAKIPVLTTVLNNVASKVHPLIKIRVRSPIILPYPEQACLAKVEKALTDGGPHILATFSNVLTWIQNWEPRGRIHLLACGTGSKTVSPRRMDPCTCFKRRSFLIDSCTT